jgi:hypothetical protein
MIDEKPLFRPRMLDARIRQVAIGDYLHSRPCEPMLLSPPPDGVEPTIDQMVTERRDRRRAHRHGVVSQTSKAFTYVCMGEGIERWPPVGRYIPKADGRRRPVGIAGLEDKIVQAAVAAILTPIYETEFLGFSYGFRPERGQHDALDALAYGLGKRRINWVLDADIRSFFDDQPCMTDTVY